jgi:hypothetical protein
MNKIEIDFFKSIENKKNRKFWKARKAIFKKKQNDRKNIWKKIINNKKNKIK